MAKIYAGRYISRDDLLKYPKGFMAKIKDVTTENLKDIPNIKGSEKGELIFHDSRPLRELDKCEALLGTLSYQALCHAWTEKAENWVGKWVLLSRSTYQKKPMLLIEPAPNPPAPKGSEPEASKQPPPANGEPEAPQGAGLEFPEENIPYE
jgi:hypothetical protein